MEPSSSDGDLDENSRKTQKRKRSIRKFVDEPNMREREEDNDGDAVLELDYDLKEDEGLIEDLNKELEEEEEAVI